VAESARRESAAWVVAPLAGVGNAEGVILSLDVKPMIRLLRLSRPVPVGFGTRSQCWHRRAALEKLVETRRQMDGIEHAGIEVVDA
jgi:hypothetical protein